MVLQQKVDSLELDLEATKSAKKSWKKAKQVLENDLKIQLEAEKKSRCPLTYIRMYVHVYVCML